MKKLLCATLAFSIVSSVIPALASSEKQAQDELDQDTYSNKICSIDTSTVQVSGDKCTFDIQCGFGYWCYKGGSGYYGVCVKD